MLEPKLTKRERLLVDVLMEYNGHPVDVTTLAKRLDAEPSVIRVNASRIRKRHPELHIDTVQGFGYAINAAPCASCDGTGWMVRRTTLEDVAADIEERLAKK